MNDAPLAVRFAAPIVERALSRLGAARRPVGVIPKFERKGIFAL
jgi:hypothetical protein